MSGSSAARSVCLAQLVITALAVLVCAAFFGKSHAIAAAWGGLTAVLPTFYFAWRAFAQRPREGAAEVVGAMYQGEIGKIALTAVLFWFGVMLFAKQFLPLLGTFVACQAAYWLALARVGIR
ncbi:ATP synthase subunit I [Solimonas marina]|uniref:F0F1 ATP synthase subunit I n=1 Tax=Solimonas marina TaxID=2714601 RepID=A0A969W5D3_9GAMM|nr:ATP synthase subunit I [Solimonas marina]NKF20772.1 F0F1 ATP synthase subunit I [Solimonas marina]